MNSQELKLEMFKMAVEMVDKDEEKRPANIEFGEDRWKGNVEYKYNSLCQTFSELLEKEKKEAAKNAPPRCAKA